MRVRARTAVWAELSEDRPALTGWLADERGVRLPGRRLLVRLGGTSARWVTTDRSGEYLLTGTALAGPTIVRVTFAGGPYHAPSSLEREVDPARLPVRLELLAPTEVSLTDEAMEIQVRAEQAERPVSVPVSISLVGSPESLVEVRTGSAGWAHASLDPTRLAQPGHHELHARYPGNLRLAPSLARAELLLVEPTTITLRARRPRVRPGDRISLHGSLEGTLGPVIGDEVSLWALGRVLASTRTGQDGSFELTVDAEDLPRGESTELLARYDSPLRARASSSSAPLQVHVTAPRPLPAWVVVVPGLASLLLLAIILAVTRRRGARPAKRPPALPDRPVTSGVQAARARPRFSLPRASNDLAGIVWDPIEDRPISDARLAVEGPGGRERLTADRQGAFAARDLEAGDHQVRVESDGYVPETFTVTCPHDGESERLRIHLVQVRHRALELYRAAASGLLPQTELWGYWTPRELAVHAAKDEPSISDEVADLTSRFEETYYSGSTGSLDDLARVRSLARALLRTREHETDRRGDG